MKYRLDGGQHADSNRSFLQSPYLSIRRAYTSASGCWVFKEGIGSVPVV